MIRLILRIKHALNFQLLHTNTPGSRSKKLWNQWQER